ncbi:MAG TPA: MFS transporter [Acidimicrobiales bacterium]|nr:MFS transporter [Acidimicrobiales bacterium]
MSEADLSEVVAPASGDVSAAPVAPTGRTYPLWPMLVMAGVSLVDQIDVSVARGVLPILEDEWHLSDTQLGLITSVFVVVSTVATIPAGWVADHYRRTRIVGWTLLSWSGLILLSATAVNYVNLLFARAAMGIGQAVDDPASTSYLGDSYPARMRGRVFSAQQVSFFLGGGIGLALGGWVGETLGWRWAFAVVGVPGALVAIAVFKLREPRRGEAELPDAMTWDEIAALPPREAEHPSGAAGLTPSQFARLAGTELLSQLKMIFGIRTMRYVLIGVAALLFTVAGISTWLPIYHERYSDMSVTQATAVTGGVLGIGGLIGTIAGGWFSDRQHHRWKGGRIVIVVWSSVLCAVLFMISFAVDPVPLRIALQFVGVVAAAGAAPGLRAAMTDVVPPDSRGVGASAMALTTSVFGTALAPVLVGAVSTLTGSLVTAFYITFPPVILGLMLLLRARHTLEDDARAIVTAIYEENQLLERQRAAIAAAERDGGSSGDADEHIDAGGDRR